MDAIDQLRKDLAEGRVSGERLLDFLAAQQRQLNAALERIAELEKRVGAAAPKVAEPFSVRAEEKRLQARGKKRRRPNKARRGRLSNGAKVQRAERTEQCFPAGVPASACRLSHTRPVWRLENGRACLIAYEIYRGPRHQYGQIAGVLGRSEFGLEIVVEIAYFVYVLGLSFDKVCLTLQFLQHLRLGKTQADALLRQLARHWQHEFEVLCTLLANALVVHADETSWSLNSVWAFLSEQARVLFFGVNKDAQTLAAILDPQTFAGLLISDDAAVYAGFRQMQKCWAHLLRKAIKLSLQAPAQAAYRQLTDGLLAIYRQACRVQRDGRLSAAGRRRKVAALEDAVVVLCAPQWDLDAPPSTGLDNDYRLLINEVMRLLLAEELFTFVTAAPAAQPNGASQPVAGTNNEAERTLRGAATARKTGRCNKTLVGARRQTILVSVLESLRLYLAEFTLASVLTEIRRWWQVGHSCFTELLSRMQRTCPAESLLDKVLPAAPDG